MFGWAVLALVSKELGEQLLISGQRDAAPSPIIVLKINEQKTITE